FAPLFDELGGPLDVVGAVLAEVLCEPGNARRGDSRGTHPSVVVHLVVDPGPVDRERDGLANGQVVVSTEVLVFPGDAEVVEAEAGIGGVVVGLGGRRELPRRDVGRVGLSTFEGVERSRYIGRDAELDLRDGGWLVPV